MGYYLSTYYINRYKFSRFNVRFDFAIVVVVVSIIIVIVFGENKPSYFKRINPGNRKRENVNVTTK